MRKLILLVLCFAPLLPALAQMTSAALPSLPKDAQEVFAAAAPFYNFSDPSLKPWHLKATYQLYDEKGNPAEQGTYEYWWASPQIYRSTWTRPSATHTDWHTADGKHAYDSSGEAIKFFEYKLQEALLSPLPEADDLDPAKVRLDRQSISENGTRFPCFMLVPQMPQHGQLQVVPLGLFPTYCFNPQIPALQVSYSFGTVTMALNKIVTMQEKFIPRQIQLAEGKRLILSATVDSITNLNPGNPALIPTPSAHKNLEKVAVSAGVAVGFLLKKQEPVYPQDAKDARVSGRVVLQAIIGTDGAVHNLRVISTPWPSLAASALWSVSQWEYKPYLLKGDPVEVETTINVIYTLGN